MARTRSGLASSAGDADFFAAALRGYEQQRSEIEGKITELRRQLSRRGAGEGVAMWAETPGALVRRKRTLSAAARQRIAQAQRKRWAAARQNPKGAVAEEPAAKRKMSAAARKRIGDSARKRWAAFRAKKAAAGSTPKVKTAGA